MLISRRYSEDEKKKYTRKQAHAPISAYDTQWWMTQRKTRLVLNLGARFVFKIRRNAECRARVNINNNKMRARKRTRTDLWIVNSITGFGWQPRTGFVLCSFVGTTIAMDGKGRGWIWLYEYNNVMWCGFTFAFSAVETARACSENQLTGYFRLYYNIR